MTDFVEISILAAFVMLGLALILTAIRLVRGPTLADRVVSLDLVAFEIIGFTAVYSIHTDHHEFLTVALVLGLFVFLGTIAFARYIEHAKDARERLQ